jgi:plastocyanin
MKRPVIVSAIVAAGFLSLGRAHAADGVVPAGRVRGVVKLDGAAPKLAPRPITKDQAVCGHDAHEPVALLTDAAGGVRNAAILLRPVSGAAPPPGPIAPALIQQNGCEYAPHVQVVPVGTKLKIVNEDDLMHNVHGYDERGETLFNLAQPLRGLSNSYTTKAPGVLRLVCDSGHPWMRAFVIVADTPWTAVSGPDGSFTIEGVPPGTYRMDLWHEFLGRSQQTVTVSPSGEARVSFAIRAPSEGFAK